MKRPLTEMDHYIESVSARRAAGLRRSRRQAAAPTLGAVLIRNGVDAFGGALFGAVLDLTGPAPPPTAWTLGALSQQPGLGCYLGWALGPLKGPIELGGASLPCASLRGADLRGADLRDAHIPQADLRGADLRGACFARAVLWRADLRGADLRGAYLQGADLQGIVIDDGEGLDFVLGH